MEYAYSILMFIFAALLFLYGFLLFRTGNYHYLPIRGRTAAKNWSSKEHVRLVGKIVMLVGCAPLLSGIVGLIIPPDRTPWPVLIVLIVSGIAAIRINRLEEFAGVLIILCTLGALVTYFYIRFVCHKLFPAYAEEQFLGMFGMLTGTASTGIILLREVDRNLKSPVSDNMVYQNLPAIVFGFPIMILATLAPVRPYLVLIILVLFFIVMNIILFRSLIFGKKK